MKVVCGVLASFAVGAAMAAPVIDFGIAQSYSGFFFGNVSGASDVEGRLAVGGNLTAGFDVGYRNPHGSSAPSLVVQGNVSMRGPWGNTGTVYNGPTYATDTNTTIGPSTAPWVNQQTALGHIVYGGTLDAASWQYGSATQQAGYLNFAAVKSQLGGLSGQLATATANGTWSTSGSSVKLVGDGSSDLQIFDLGNFGQIGNLSFENIKDGAHIVINSSATQIDFSGWLGGDRADSTDFQAQHRDRLVFNLHQAENVRLAGFLNGSVLAINAAVSGSGHLEGTLIADSLGPRAGDGARLELGYEPFVPRPGDPDSNVPDSTVPEPETFALFLLGLGTMGVLARRRRRQG